MKKIITAILILASFNSTAQIDSSILTVTVTLPVKAVVLYSYYLSQSSNLGDRKAPDQIVALIGTGTLPDSLVTVTLTSGRLFNFTARLLSERDGAITTVSRSIFNNLPAITGYTGLISQIQTIAAGNGAQKPAATFFSKSI